MSNSGRFLVTGADGFIGRHVVNKLNGEGYEVLSWNREACDLSDKDLVAKSIKKLKPSCIIHLAASSVGGAADSWTVISHEVQMISNLVEAMPSHCRFVHIGSMAEYGYAGYFDELAPCRPNTSYGAAKLSCTHYALATRLTHQLDIHVARLFGVYGQGENSKRLLPNLVSNLAAGNSIALSDGLQLRDFVHVDDVSTLLLKLANASNVLEPVLNIGTGVGVTVRSVCETVASILDADPALLQFGEMPRRTVDEDVLVAKTDRLSKFAEVPRQRWLLEKDVEDYVCGLAEQ